MNIIEAVKSGKKFKIRTCSFWRDTCESHMYSAEELLSDDWEVEEKKVEVTKQQLFQAFIDMTQGKDFLYMSRIEIINGIASRIGLE